MMLRGTVVIKGGVRSLKILEVPIVNLQALLVLQKIVLHSMSLFLAAFALLLVFNLLYCLL